MVQLWKRTGFLDTIGRDHVFADKHSAIAAIVPRLDATICASCRVRVFDECAARPGAVAPSTLPTEEGDESGAGRTAAC